MAQELLRFKCSACKNANYYSSKNKKTVEKKLDLKKFCSKCKKTTKHKESKITG